MAFAALGDARARLGAVRADQPAAPRRDGGRRRALQGRALRRSAADVYSVAPHTGRGGWTWYTGSAGWMYRLIVESLLGRGGPDRARLGLGVRPPRARVRGGKCHAATRCPDQITRARTVALGPTLVAPGPARRDGARRRLRLGPARALVRRARLHGHGHRPRRRGDRAAAPDRRHARRRHRERALAACRCALRRGRLHQLPVARPAADARRLGGHRRRADLRDLRGRQRNRRQAVEPGLPAAPRRAARGRARLARRRLRRRLPRRARALRAAHGRGP